MNAERIAHYMQAMHAHFAKKGVLNVTFIHFGMCPCTTGTEPLDQCNCVPALDIDGKKYLLQVTAQLVPVKP